MRGVAAMAWLAGCTAEGTSPSTGDSGDPSDSTPIATGDTRDPTTPPFTSTDPTLAGYAVPPCTATADPTLECGGPPSCGHLIDVHIVNGEVPVEATTGGTLLDGMYVLVAYVVHSLTQDSLTLPADIEQVVVIAGNTIRGNVGATGDGVLGYGETFEILDGFYVPTPTCPTKGEPQERREYGFDGVLWRLLGHGNDRTQEAVYLYLGPE